MISRKKDFQNIKHLIDLFSVTAILGARQCGKTTLAKTFKYDHYFDLENPIDLAKLDNPQLSLQNLSGLIVIDEIQRAPELFPTLRFLVDNNKEQKYLILGSASRNLIRQSSESLAGRIAYYRLGGFRISDVGEINIQLLWFQGTLPPAYLSKTAESARLWRDNYITTYLERDIPQLGINIPSATLRRFWTMLSHYHAQVLNYADLGRSFGVSDMTIRHYLEILEGTYMIRLLRPWHVNIKKRLVKRPKIYLRDSGIFHTLMTVDTIDQLFAHPKLGASWEGFALECVCQTIGRNDQDYYFWSTHSGAEVDLFWQSGGKNWAIEFKYMDAPLITKSMHSALTDLDLAHLWIIYPGKEKYNLGKNITAFPLSSIVDVWEY
jgi:predicted AAA+ superfamily ATPase